MQPPCAKRRRINAVDEPARNETETIQPEMAWNKEMNAFYNDPCNFAMNGLVVDEITEQWSVLSNSTSSCPSGYCLKCGENTFSLEEECAECAAETAIELEIGDSRVAREYELSNSPKQGTNCIACESSGHSSACCLKCGEKTDSFEEECNKCVTEASYICQICGYRGHLEYNCIINSWNATIAPSTWHHNKVLENLRNSEECAECAAETAIELEIGDSRVARESELSNSPKQGTNCIACESSGNSGACCLKCGEKTDSFEEECNKCVTEASYICQICGYRGHLEYNCIINSWNATIAP